jgi:hypothetical protein
MYERTYHKTVLKTETKGMKRKGRRINWRLVVLIAGTVVVIVGIIFLIRLPKVQVKTIDVQGTNVAYPGDVSAFVQMQLQGNKLFVLPRSSIFLVPTHTLEKEIKAAFPRFQTVTVTRKNFSTLLVNVTEYQGVYLWCADTSDCYFMDQNGMVFAPAPYFSGDAYPKIFIGTLQTLPFQALTPVQISSVSVLVDHLTALGITPSEFHYISDRELDVYFVHNSQQATLMIDPTMNIDDVLTVLVTGLRTDPLATNFRDPNKMLQYIDLRFLDRVVYKFQ